jgi:hypothetical protein
LAFDAALLVAGTNALKPPNAACNWTGAVLTAFLGWEFDERAAALKDK